MQHAIPIVAAQKRTYKRKTVKILTKEKKRAKSMHERRSTAARVDTRPELPPAGVVSGGVLSTQSRCQRARDRASDVDSVSDDEKRLVWWCERTRVSRAEFWDR